MAGIRELRARIKSVGNIKQITRAMEMVATTKLRRFQDRALSSRPYTDEIKTLVGRLASVLGEEALERPLFREGTGGATAVLLVTSDRGLCGAYNSNLFKAVEEFMLARHDAGDERPVHFFVYGKKGYKYLTKRGRHVERFLVDPPLEEIDFANAARASRILTEGFEAGHYDRVHVLYTAFESVVRYVPRLMPFLPIDGAAVAGDDEEAGTGDVILEPDAEAIFNSLIPRYLETVIYNALLESLTSEYASRRVSMKNATDAASDMQSDLKLQYNRQRQTSITMDLLDIVGGAEAIK